MDPDRLPTVFYEEFSASCSLPMLERNIFVAVIQRAILDYQSKGQAEREHRRSARVFLFSDNPNLSRLRLYAEWLFSDPDAFIIRLRKEVKAGTIRPKQVACISC